MREIKFEYIYSNWKDFIKKSFSLDEISNWDCYEFMSDMPMYKDYKLLTYRQYTWLKDKNWKEIYEGDIVMGWMWFEYHYWTLKLKFYKIDWFWNKRDEIDYYPWFNFCFNYDEGKFTSLEIIWNIYENPNLINNN